MLINYNGVPCPKADTLLRFAEPEVVLGQGTSFYCRYELANSLIYIFSNIRRRGPSRRNLGYNSFDKGWWNYETRKRQRSI